MNCTWLAVISCCAHTKPRQEWKIRQFSQTPFWVFFKATLYFCVLFWSYVCNATFSLGGKSAKKSELLVFKHKLRTSLEISKLVVSSKKGWWYQLFIEHQSFIAIKIFWTWNIFCSTFERICNYPLYFSISNNVEIFVEG